MALHTYITCARPFLILQYDKKNRKPANNNLGG